MTYPNHESGTPTGKFFDVDLVLEDKGEDEEDAAKNVGRHDEERHAEVAQYSWIS